MRIFSGDNTLLTDEAARFENKIVLDALSLLIISKMDMLPILDVFEEIHITSSNVIKIKSECMDGLTRGRHSFAYRAYKAIESFENIYIRPDSPEISDVAQQFHIPKYLYDAVVYAVENDMPFLYADEMILHLFKFIFEGTVKTISISSILRNLPQADVAKDYVYRLLKSNYQFINFNAYDMYYQISQNGFDLSKADIEPFFRCKSDHDMLSFGNVYCHLLERLIYEKQKDCAIDFVSYVFKFIDKTSRRSEYYKRMLEYNEDSVECKIKYYTMQRFVMHTLAWLFEILYFYGEPYSFLIEECKFEYISHEVVEKAKLYCLEGQATNK